LPGYSVAFSVRASTKFTTPVRALDHVKSFYASGIQNLLPFLVEAETLFRFEEIASNASNERVRSGTAFIEVGPERHDKISAKGIK
jgi:hypothetical protein